MKEDKLKDLFNETFASEPIAFDQADWHAFEAAMDAGKKRRGAYYWSGGLAALMLAATAWLLWLGEEPIYNPRDLAHSQRFSSLEASLNDEATSYLKASAGTKSILTGTATTAMAKDPTSNRSTSDASNESIVAEASTQASSEVLSTSPTPDRNDIVSGAITAQPSESHAPIEDQRIIQPNVGRLNNIENMELEVRKDLALMMTLHATAPAETYVPKDRPKQAGLEASTKWEPYIRLGVGYGAAGKIGQTGGVGLSKQVAERLLLGGELNLTRDLVSFSTAQSKVVYGYGKYERTLRVSASEVLSVQLPLIARVRFNRFSVGTGVSGQYSFAVKVSEDRSTSNSTENATSYSSERSDLGYVRWDAVRPFNVEVLGDIQYQLNEYYFIGGRGSIPIQDAFLSNDIADRPYRLEFYLKMRIRP